MGGLTHKLAMLLALTTKQRVQTLHSICIDNINFCDSYVYIHIRKLLKHSRCGNYKFSLNLHQYHDRSICVVRTLKLYLQRTSLIRGDCKQLFVSYCKPYGDISKETISRWLKRVMFEAGIDTSMFKAHILKLAGWTNVRTFDKYYDKVVLPYC